mgnify:CR=1 FL=1
MRCSKCKEEKSEECFYKKSKDKFHSWCKQCLYLAQRERWKDRKRKAVELMGGKCSSCGYKKSLAALDFHHLNPEIKDLDWGKMKLRKWSTVVEELKKCILVCSNCHREIHSPELNTIFEDQGKSNVRLNDPVKPTGICPMCEDPVYGTTHCSQYCSRKSKRKVIHPSEKELRKLLDKKT